jgi:hypothetical protein
MPATGFSKGTEDVGITAFLRLVRCSQYLPLPLRTRVTGSSIYSSALTGREWLPTLEKDVIPPFGAFPIQQMFVGRQIPLLICLGGKCT